MVPCTQIPAPIVMGASKRTRRPGQWRAHAQGEVTTPRTPRRSTPKNVAMEKCGLGDLAQQTPILQSGPESGLGPPPRDTTPTPLRETSTAPHGLMCLFVLEVCIRRKEFILTHGAFHRWTAGSSQETIKGGEREDNAIQAQEAACMDAAPSHP